MSRSKLSEEIKRKAALEQAVAQSPRMAYPSPAQIAVALKKNGTTISRQAVRNYFIEAGIVIDSETGLWVKEEKKGKDNGKR